MARSVAETYFASRETLGFPMLATVHRADEAMV
jgi:hypothetical protein